MRKALTPWRVQKVSDIGLFLRKRSKPLARGQLRKHFRILLSFGRNQARLNELKAFARLSPESMAEFLRRELGISVKVRSACDEAIKRLLKLGFGRGEESLERLALRMHSKFSRTVLSKKDFVNLFKACSSDLEIQFKEIATNLHSASRKGFSALSKRLGFQIIQRQEAFNASAELKALLSEALQDSSINIGSTLQVRDIANNLLSIVSDSTKIQVLERAQRETEETMCKWLGIPKAGVRAKRKSEKQLIRRHKYDKEKFNARAREKQRLRRERQAFPKRN